MVCMPRFWFLVIWTFGFALYPSGMGIYNVSEWLSPFVNISLPFILNFIHVLLIIMGAYVCMHGFVCTYS